MRLLFRKKKDALNLAKALRAVGLSAANPAREASPHSMPPSWVVEVDKNETDVVVHVVGCLAAVAARASQERAMAIRHLEELKSQYRQEFSQLRKELGLPADAGGPERRTDAFPRRVIN